VRASQPSTHLHAAGSVHQQHINACTLGCLGCLKGDLGRIFLVATFVQRYLKQVQIKEHRYSSTARYSRQQTAALLKRVVRIQLGNPGICRSHSQFAVHYPLSASQL
jgi:hypothetical protein